MVDTPKDGERVTVYVPRYPDGTILGSAYARPWLAETLAEATGRWFGLPVFRTAALATAWIDWWNERNPKAAITADPVCEQGRARTYTGRHPGFPPG